jgi:hypothetical protein
MNIEVVFFFLRNFDKFYQNTQNRIPEGLVLWKIRYLFYISDTARFSKDQDALSFTP